jgi:hypothetical protein
VPARLLTLLVVSACGLTLAACSTSEDQRVRDTLKRFERATAHRDYGTLCSSVLSREIVGRLESIGLPCELALRKGLGGVSGPKLEVQKVKIRGRIALAQVRSTASGERPSVDTIKLVREGKDWRIASLAGVQPPAPQRSLAGESP